MLKIVECYPLKNRFALFVDMSGTQGIINVGDVLADDNERHFVLSGVSMIRYCDDAAMLRQRHKVPIIMRPIDDVMTPLPVGSLRVVDTYKHEDQDGSAALPTT